MSDSVNALIGAQRSGGVLDAIAHPPQINPLAGISAAGDAVKTVMGVRGLAAQQAWGEALAASTDPTGRIDYNAALARLSKDDRGPLGMANAASTSSPLMNDQVNRAHYQMGIYQGLIGGLPDDASREQITAAFDKAEALGLSPTDVAKEKAMIPTDDKAMPGFVQQLRLSGSSGLEQLQGKYGTRPAVPSNEGVTFPVVPPPNSTAAPPFVGKGLSPEWLLAPSTFPPVPERDASGNPTGHTIPLSNGEWLELNNQLPKGTMDTLKKGGGSMGTGRPAPAAIPPPPPAPRVPGRSDSGLPPVGSNALAPPGVQVAGGGSTFAPATGAPTAPGPAVAGDVAAMMQGVDNARAASGAPAAPPAANAPAAVTFNVPTGRAALTLSPDEVFRLEHSGGDFRKEMDTGTTAIQQSALLGNMLADTAGFAPGKDATALQAFQGKVQYWTPGIAKAFGIDPAALANKESFDKVAAQIANAQGAQSDARLAVVEAATPHSEMTPAGVDKIIRQLQGNTDYLQYRAKVAATYPRQYDYRGFQKDVQQLDPRVFQLTRMTDPQRQEYWKQLDSTAQKEVGAAIRYKAQLDKTLAGQ